MSSRERHLNVEDEEELLMLQEEMRLKRETPAARVTRVTKSQPSTSTASQPQQPSITKTTPRTTAPSSMPTNPLSSILRDVKFHPSTTEDIPYSAPSLKQQQSAGETTAAFPVATHRKLSKFALGRKKPATQTPSSITATTSSSIDTQHLEEAVDNDKKEIDAENTQLIASMTAEQLEEARAELLARLPPSTVEFLKNRALGAGSTSNNSNTRGGKKSVSFAATETTTPHKNNQRRSVPATSALEKRKKQAQLETAQKELETVKKKKAAIDLAARVRFNLSGNPISLAYSNNNTTSSLESTTEKEEKKQTNNNKTMDVSSVLGAVNRDPLRADEAGVGSEGYTIKEACDLARSTVYQQRIVALCLLGHIVRLCRPGSCTNATNIDEEEYSIQVPVDGELEQQKRIKKVAKADVWFYALHEARIVYVLRHALDDAKPAVVAAASRAISELIRPGTEAIEAWEAASCNPLVGWPVVAMRHMQRQHVNSPWIAAPANKRSNNLTTTGGVSSSDDEDAFDEKELAKVDPVGGLLHMALPERVVHIVKNLQVAAAVAPLLDILCTLCMAGHDVVNRLISTAGFLDMMKLLLDASPLSTPTLGGIDAEFNAACIAARPSTLKVLSLLAQSSKKAASVLQDSGLVRYAYEPILRGISSISNGSVVQQHQKEDTSSSKYVEQQQKVLERVYALRFWRCMSLHGQFVMPMDDAYPAICHYLTPDIPSIDKKALFQWSVAREVYLAAAELCWQMVPASTSTRDTDNQQSRQPIPPSLSGQCADALASQALQWLTSIDGNTLIKCLDNADIVSTLSAALHFLGSFWTTQDWHSLADKSLVREKLLNSGILSIADDVATEYTSLPTVVAKVLQQQLVSQPWQQESSSENNMTLFTTMASLSVALVRLEAAFEDFQDQQASLQTTTVSDIVLVQPLLVNNTWWISQAAERYSTDCTLLQPWDMPHLQRTVVYSRMLAVACNTLTSSGKDASPQKQSLVVSAALKACMNALCALPPGEESTALKLLSFILLPSNVQIITKAAQEYITSSSDTTIAALAKLAGQQQQDEQISCITSGSIKAERISKVLLAGYAAVWLGMLQEDEAYSSDNDTKTRANPLLQPMYMSGILQPQGSQLPLSAEWPLVQAPLPPSDSLTTDGEEEECYVAAVLWTLGLETTNTLASSSININTQQQKKLKTAVKLIFLPPAYHQQSSQDSATIWLNPAVRWPLAALLTLYSSSSVSTTINEQKVSSLWTVPEAQRLATHFAATSVGDALFGVAVVACLLCSSSSSSLEVQLEVLQALADEKALHLLPPLSLCPGSKESYLKEPAEDVSQNKSAIVGKKPGEDAANGGIELYMKLLSEGALWKCVDSGSMALDLIIHRLASYAFSTIESGDISERRQKQAVISGVIRRCTGVSKSNEPAAAHMLSMFMRWDCESMQPEDVVTADRLRLVEEAVKWGGQGDDDEGLLSAVMDALHIG